MARFPLILSMIVHDEDSDDDGGAPKEVNDDKNNKKKKAKNGIEPGTSKIQTSQLTN